jgi:hypothetical protein
MYRVEITRNVSYLHKGTEAGGWAQFGCDTIKQNNEYKSCKFNLELLDVSENTFSFPHLYRKPWSQVDITISLHFLSNLVQFFSTKL